MEPSAIFFWIVVIIGGVVLYVKSLKKENEADKKRAEERTVDIKEFEQVKTLYNQFKDYLDNLFEEQPAFEHDELDDILNRDFPHYKKHFNRSTLFTDLVRAEILGGGGRMDSLWRKGDAFYDLRLNFTNFQEFLEHDCFGRKYTESGFVDKHFEDELDVTKVKPVIKDNGKHSWDSKRTMRFSIAKGSRHYGLKDRPDYDKNQAYLFCEFTTRGEDYSRILYSKIVLAQPIYDDWTKSEYQAVYDKMFKQFQAYNS